MFFQFHLGFYHKLRGNQGRDNNVKLDDCSLNEIKMDENLFSNHTNHHERTIIGDKPPPIITSTSNESTENDYRKL